ncbi:MAG: peptidyl-prolyl cis-trans isomerase [Alphaproteobacteria bacterium]
MRWIREPLVHFIAAGAALFAVFLFVSPEEQPDVGPQPIVVDRDALVTFIQYRTKRFDPAAAEARLDTMSARDRQQLIDDFVREEVLYREARALGLEGEDYVIRRRLVQKLEYAMEGVAVSDAGVRDAEVQSFFEANRQAYVRAPSITFSHVYFSAMDRGTDTALEMADKASVVLAGGDLHAGTDLGDYFPYHRTYVEREPDLVASHFGRDFAARVFDIDSSAVWVGPIESAFGYHLVYVQDKRAGGVPPLAEVRSRVVADMQRQAGRQRSDALVADLISRYEIEVVFEPAAEQARAVSGD